MNSIRIRGENIRKFLLENIADHPSDIATLAAKEFGITRQAINKHLTRLVEEGVMEKKGKTRNLSYHLRPLSKWSKLYEIDDSLAEDVVLRQDIIPTLGNLPDNVAQIWSYGFTEMFNNAIDHSEGTYIQVQIEKTATTTTMHILDDGVGIFRKIQKALHLLDERHAVLELSKGKLTTDPDNHTGEGIFFSSRMFDSFAILSGETYFSHKYGEQEDWILEGDSNQKGTLVWMTLNNHTARTPQGIFKEYSTGDDFGFTKTVVPVKLTRYGNENLVSRSQAKRMLARVEKFQTVLLDFNDVEEIGQAFADEIFRVFQNRHPEIELIPINANTNIHAMIERALQHNS